MEINDTKISIFFFCIGIIGQLLLLIVLIRNILKKKSLISWIFPDGTSKRERILMFAGFVVSIFSGIIGAVIIRM